MPMNPQRSKKLVLYLAGLILAVCAVVWFVSHLVMPRLALSAAVGGDQGEAQKFMTALAPLAGGERWRMRFRYVPFEDPEAAAKAMDEGRLDLMLSRSDIAPRAKGQTLVIIRRDALLLLLPPDAAVDEFADLADNTVAIPEGPLRSRNEALLDLLLDFYSVPRTEVKRLALPAGEIGRALKRKRAAAAFVVGDPGFGQASEIVASVTKALGQAPEIMEFPEAGAIAKKLPQLETLEIPRGAVNGNPAIPEESLVSLAVSVRLLASSDMSRSLAGGITRVVTSHKAALAEALQGAARIEAPDTEDRAAILPTHPGASAYFSGEQSSFFDRIEYFIYYIGLLASAVGYIIAWAMGRRNTAATRDLSEEIERRTCEMLAAVREIPAAGPGRRTAIALDLEKHADWALEELVAGRLDRDRYGTIEALLSRGRAELKRPAPADSIAAGDPPKSSS